MLLFVTVYPNIRTILSEKYIAKLSSLFSTTLGIRKEMTEIIAALGENCLGTILDNLIIFSTKHKSEFIEFGNGLLK